MELREGQRDAVNTHLHLPGGQTVVEELSLLVSWEMAVWVMEEEQVAPSEEISWEAVAERSARR